MSNIIRVFHKLGKSSKTEENQVWAEVFGIMTAIYVDVNRWVHAFDMKLAR